MSGWDWIHAGLEVATLVKAQQAQRNLTEMKTAVEMESARRVLLEAMKSFIFDISRDIKLAEEQIAGFPQQVYIISRSLDWRLANSGLSAEVFPDFESKEYVFNTQKKIEEVVKRAKASLTEQQIQQSEMAVHCIVEMPLLQQAISTKSAQESLWKTDAQWKKLSSQRSVKSLSLVLGIIGLVLTSCISLPMLPSGISMLGKVDSGSTLLVLFLIAIGVAIAAVSIMLVIFGGKPNPEFAPLKANREAWQKQVMPRDEWQQVKSSFGDLTSEQFKKVFNDRLAFLEPLLGNDFQKYLTSN